MLTRSLHKQQYIGNYKTMPTLMFCLLLWYQNATWLGASIIFSHFWHRKLWDSCIWGYCTPPLFYEPQLSNCECIFGNKACNSTYHLDFSTIGTCEQGDRWVIDHWALPIAERIKKNSFQGRGSRKSYVHTTPQLQFVARACPSFFGGHRSIRSYTCISCFFLRTQA